MGKILLEVTIATTLSNRLLQMGRLEISSGFFNDFEVKYYSNGLRSATLIPLRRQSCPSLTASRRRRN